jgi:hypothetical protein
MSRSFAWVAPFLLLAGARAAVADEKPACPYRGESTHSSIVLSAGIRNDVLDNLDRLDLAQELCARADTYLKEGRAGLAQCLYQQVRELCPGSRYDAMATTHLLRLAASAKKENARRVDAEVAEQVENGQRQYADGYYTDARGSAAFALCLKPDCPVARVLFDKCVRACDVNLEHAGASPAAEEQEDDSEPSGAETPFLVVNEAKQTLVIESLEPTWRERWCDGVCRWLGRAFHESLKAHADRHGQ